MHRIGFVIDFQKKNWLGGYNYFKNFLYLIKLNQENQIEPVIFTDSKANLLQDSFFCNIEIIENRRLFSKNSYIRILNKIIIIIFGKNLFLDNFFKRHNIVAISHSTFLGKKSLIKSFPWFPDFQEIYFPNNFSLKNILLRRLNIFLSEIHSTKIIVSSRSVQLDLLKINEKAYKKSNIIKHNFNIVNFNKIKSIDYLNKKFKIKKKFFFLPNHYWIHKNHIVVLKAIKLIKNITNIQIVTTGLQNDHRHPDYMKKILRFVNENNIKDNYIMLGIVNSSDLMSLMYHSVAIINPSKSEGWGNSVDQAKIMEKRIILSDIPVHKEQKAKNLFYFNSDNYKRLSSIFLDLNNKIDNKTNYIKYNLNQNHIKNSSYIKKYQDFIISNL